MDPEQPFFPNFISCYFIALGVLLGGCLIGGIGAYLSGQPPLTIITSLANRLKIWALVAAIGGTFDAVYSFERGIIEGNTRHRKTASPDSFGDGRSADRLSDHQLAHTGAYFLMRIPPYYKKPGWQRFFAGMMCGAIISWVVFLFTYGTFQEKQVVLIREQKERINDLNDQITIYREDLHKLNEDNKRKLLIQSVDVKLINGKQYKLSQPDMMNFEERIRDNISDVITKDIESVYRTKELLKRTIENKEYTINDKTYKAKVTELTIYTRLSVEIKISFSE